MAVRSSSPTHIDKRRAAVSNRAAPCAVIEPDGAETWCERTPLDPFNTDPEIVRARIRDAGVVGLGGAARELVPTRAKVAGPAFELRLVEAAAQGREVDAHPSFVQAGSGCRLTG